MNHAESSLAEVPTAVKFTAKQLSNFWGRVKKSDDCWEWTGCIDKGSHGYGYFRIGSKMLKVHRVSWMINFGEIPHDGSFHGICVCHKCDNKICVNPDHLFLGTQKENMTDCVRKGRLNHVCGHNHFARLHPELMARGDNHGSRLHPEKRPRGEGNGASKLSSEKVIEIRRLHATGEFPKKELASRFGVCRNQISQIVRRKNWTHI